METGLYGAVLAIDRSVHDHPAVQMGDDCRAAGTVRRRSRCRPIRVESAIEDPLGP